MQHIISQTTEQLRDSLHYHTIRFAPLPEYYIRPRDWINCLAYDCLGKNPTRKLPPELRTQLRQIIRQTPEQQAYQLLKTDQGLNRINILSLAELLEISFATLPGYEFMALLEELDTLLDLLIYNFAPMEVPTLS